jgi:hypothetical protein
MKKGIAIGIIIGILLSGIVAYATSVLSSDKVSYDKTTVKDSLDNLFNESLTGKNNIISALSNKGFSVTNNATYNEIVKSINELPVKLSKDEEGNYGYIMTNEAGVEKFNLIRDYTSELYEMLKNRDKVNEELLDRVDENMSYSELLQYLKMLFALKETVNLTASKKAGAGTVVVSNSYSVKSNGYVENFSRSVSAGYDQGYYMRVNGSVVDTFPYQINTGDIIDCYFILGWSDQTNTLSFSFDIYYPDL